MGLVRFKFVNCLLRLLARSSPDCPIAVASLLARFSDLLLGFDALRVSPSFASKPLWRKKLRRDVVGDNMSSMKSKSSKCLLACFRRSHVRRMTIASRQTANAAPKVTKVTFSRFSASAEPAFACSPGSTELMRRTTHSGAGPTTRPPPGKLSSSSCLLGTGWM